MPNAAVAPRLTIDGCSGGRVARWGNHRCEKVELKIRAISADNRPPAADTAAATLVWRTAGLIGVDIRR